MALVVAAAIVRDGRVLACRRTAPAEAAGRWELPGGKVEADETPEAALIREIGEELGCLVAVDEWFDISVPIPAPSGSPEHELRAALCHVTVGEIRPREHDAVQWLLPDELETLDWLEPDRPFLEILAGPTVVQRAFFYEEDDATSVVERLTADGWDAEARRERFHGEDDDEDQPWLVVTDAPVMLLEALADEYEGWIDYPEEAPDGSIAPAPLPDAPKRIKRPSPDA